ncbi:GTPase [Vibrio sp. Vb1018]|uniref:GTPase n=1 Tax=Vibrio sp. Vb1018 TaxID=3074636 RepID=UPI002963FF6C|nr:GTPase [Vibrio sp. Vb1018]MDW1821579.1 GTPase [Vibrio sp. Vb1018]
MDINTLIQLVPESERNIKRLRFIKQSSNTPRIAVFGKYNHGKSTLLNAIIGHEVFKAADKRETVKNSEFEHNGVIWIDTPGLDADVHQNDDKAAMKGAFDVADYIFLVHQVTAGELDKKELQIFNQLAKQDKNYRQKMCIVLTQVDQKSADDLNQIRNKIENQLLKSIELKDLAMIAVSAARHLKGIKENKLIFCERSGMDQLFCLISEIKENINTLRVKEIERLKRKLSLEIDTKKKQIQDELNQAKYIYNKNITNFEKDIRKFATEVSLRG